jgi:putative transposase
MRRVFACLIVPQEAKNAKLKRLLAERDLELDVMREVNRKKW